MINNWPCSQREPFFLLLPCHDPSRQPERLLGVFLRDLRTIVDDKGDPWFVAKDICDRLDIRNPSDAVHCLEDYQKSALSITDPHGREQVTTVVNESGLYQLIFKSRKPVAKKFQHWVTSEVIPSIRKHGMYATPGTVEQMLANPDTMIKAERTLF